jgi:hypothetical protein
MIQITYSTQSEQIGAKYAFKFVLQRVAHGKSVACSRYIYIIHSKIKIQTNTNKLYENAGFEVLMAVTMKSTVFRDVSSCRLVPI